LKARPTSKAPRLKWLDGNPSLLSQRLSSAADPLEKPAGADRHNAESCHQDESGKLVLKSALKKGGISRRSASNPDLSSEKVPLRGAAAKNRPKSSPPIPSSRRIPGGAPTQRNTKVRAKVYRFFLRFDPPALAIEWGSGLTDDSLSQSLAASNSLGDGQRSRTHIPLKLEHLADDLVALSNRVVRDYDFLSSRHLPRIEKLLRQLASQVLPIYRVLVKEAPVQEFPGTEGNGDLKRASTLPSGALVLAREKVRHPDGWWIRIWTGQWIQCSYVMFGEESAGMPLRAKSMVEQCDPSALEVKGWLDEAARSRRNLLLDNAKMVARQFGLKPEDIPSALRIHLQS